ncbi:MAG: hypothetical protein FWD53_06805 [Phycisphaerales bacterium]|nr:hypothetical protein [Phycisphaerales bacterium]
MKMAEELKLLEERRAAEMRYLRASYLRTKRAVKRTTSVDRVIRKHMAASLGVAVLAGLILARMLRRKRVPREQAASGHRGGVGSTLHRLFAETVAMVLTRLNLPKMVADAVTQARAKKSSGGE